MRTVLGLEPRWTTREAFADFVLGRRLHGPFSPEVLDRFETALRGLASLAKAS
jgi:hypothetical protein